MTRFALTAALALGLASPVAAQDLLTLTLLDGGTPPYTATLGLQKPGVVQGRGPCNSYSAPLTADLPAFKIAEIMATKMACPDLAAEQQFFDLLRQMDHVDQTADSVTLTGAGHELVFSSLP